MRPLVLLGILALSSVASADRIDDLAKKVIREELVPGMTIAILREGKPVKQAAYGFAEVENRVPARVNTVYELASLSKQFTAVSTLMLVEEGKLALDDPITKYFPESAERWSGMTIRHLLNHTSGLNEFYFRPDRMNALSFMRYSRAQTLEDLLKSQLLFRPGQKFGYSNSGYELLGLLIEKASGMPFATFVRQRLLDPAGMTQTYIRDNDTIIPNRAQGYTRRNGKIARWTLASTLQALDVDAFGEISSTVGDLAKWDKTLSDGRWLSASSWRAAWTPGKLNDGTETKYGFGWMLNTVRGDRWVWHTGHTGTVMIRVPESNLTLIVLTNLGSGNPAPYGRDSSFDLYGFTDRLMGLVKARYGKK